MSILSVDLNPGSLVVAVWEVIKDLRTKQDPLKGDTANYCASVSETIGQVRVYLPRLILHSPQDVLMIVKKLEHHVVFIEKNKRSFETTQDVKYILRNWDFLANAVNVVFGTQYITYSNSGIDRESRKFLESIAEEVHKTINPLAFLWGNIQIQLNPELFVNQGDDYADAPQGQGTPNLAPFPKPKERLSAFFHRSLKPIWKKLKFQNQGRTVNRNLNDTFDPLSNESQLQGDISNESRLHALPLTNTTQSAIVFDCYGDVDNDGDDSESSVVSPASRNTTKHPRPGSKALHHRGKKPKV